MSIDFQVTFTANCDIEDAVVEYEALIDNGIGFDQAIYDAIEENLTCSKDGFNHIPKSVIEGFAHALRKRLGGVQLEMELD